MAVEIHILLLLYVAVDFNGLTPVRFNKKYEYLLSTQLHVKKCTPQGQCCDVVIYLLYFLSQKKLSYNNNHTGIQIATVVVVEN